MDSKTKAIISHIGIFGWIIAFMVNQNSRDSYTTFYLRQNLVLVSIGTIIYMLKAAFFLSGLLSIIVFVFWLISLINCINNKVEVIPFIGSYFQEWFKGI